MGHLDLECECHTHTHTHRTHTVSEMIHHGRLLTPSALKLQRDREMTSHLSSVCVCVTAELIADQLFFITYITFPIRSLSIT